MTSSKVNELACTNRFLATAYQLLLRTEKGNVHHVNELKQQWIAAHEGYRGVVYALHH